MRPPAASTAAARYCYHAQRVNCAAAGSAGVCAVPADAVHEPLSSQLLRAGAAAAALPRRPGRTRRPPGQEDPRGVQSAWPHRTARPRTHVLPLRRRTFAAFVQPAQRLRAHSFQSTRMHGDTHWDMAGGRYTQSGSQGDSSLPCMRAITTITVAICINHSDRVRFQRQVSM